MPDAEAPDFPPPTSRHPRCGCCGARVTLVGVPNKMGRGGTSHGATEGRLLWACPCPAQRAAHGDCFWCHRCPHCCACPRPFFPEGTA